MAGSTNNSPLGKSEDYLLERKTQNDLKDLLKTLVAFANTVRPGHVATILIGERDDGAPEGLSNADEIQKRVRREADKIYPHIIWRSETYVKDAKECVKVEIEYSGDTPHFGGPAWIRRGSKSVPASDHEFQRLIDIRSGIVRELDQWVNKTVTVKRLVKHIRSGTDYLDDIATLRFVNQFYLTVIVNSAAFSYPLKRVTLSWDDSTARLKIIVDLSDLIPVRGVHF